VRIVSNASPLINLARIGKLDLLRELYGKLFIPDGVWNEIVVEGTGQPGADEVKEAVWIERREVKNKQLVQALLQEMDAGEAEAIVLALEERADWLLMDEHLGREIAGHFKLHCIGLVGVLILAKHKGLISAIKPCLDGLTDLAGFRLKDSLYTRILRDENET
jgi:predicted nucleic acid-binding protein